MPPSQRKPASTVLKRRKNSWWKSGRLFFAVAVIGGLATLYLTIWRTLTPQQDRQAAATAMQESRFAEARKLSGRVLDRLPGDEIALLIAARSAAAINDWPDAFALCDRFTDAERRTAARRLFTLGEAMVRVGKARRAEETLRLTLYLNPQHLDATFILAFILGAEGRAWDAAPLVRTLVEHNRFGVPQLLLLGATDEYFIDQPQFVSQCQSAVPDDPLPLLAVARTALARNDSDSAEAALRRIVSADPTQIEAQARWGLWLLDHQREDAFHAWHQSLPSVADEHPEIWSTRGLYALQQHQNQAAIRCFGEAARRDPNHLVSHFHLGKLLAETGRSDLAAQFRARTEQLSELLVSLGACKQNSDAKLMQRVAEMCESLGRPRESVAWAELSMRTESDTEWATLHAERLRNSYSGEVPWILDEARLADAIKLDALPLPTWGGHTSEVTKRTLSNSGAGNEISFSEDAAKLGIDFRYYNDAKEADSLLRMFEFTGGGLGVIDFDSDGWPDLYATQGSRFPCEPDPPVHLDRLFRNRGQVMFDDVTLASCLGDSRFSAGVTIGDFDQDGFPDVYLANIGPNRLYRNNGDGTFEDVTEMAELEDDDWTTSCVLADLNGDAMPDIFAVNYLSGPEIYTRICESGGRLKSCLPANFEPQQDRVWMNLGNGTFQEQTTTSLERERFAGRGLGVVVAGIDGSDYPGVFVANDTDPNFFQVNCSERGSQQIQFEDQGAALGLALSGEGNAQAGMGIASGDIDRDGRLDFFVTNFYREPNALYLQRGERIFQDETKSAGLYDPSFLMLGFGTQCLDADADGWLDLIVANGHVYNNTNLQEPFTMRSQLFRNTGSGKFVEIRTPKLGTYFEELHLGRSLVRWDYNRDGLPDAAISNLTSPLSILTNRTETRNHTLVISLRGIASNRDAIGSVVRVTAGLDQWMIPLTAGDGYQASNDRRLIVGLGRESMADQIVISWPSGFLQMVKNVSAGAEYVLVEGREPVIVGP